MSKQQGRWIVLDAGLPAQNMAIDQTLLESVDRDSIPVLRCYTWSQPTLSLGYFQSLDARRHHAESAGLCCVRRSTGGGAIVHHHELTYSVAVPVTDSWVGPRLELYQRTHAALAEALSDFSVQAVPYRCAPHTLAPPQGEEPFLCFQRRTAEDLVVSGYKVLGSAQRKSRRAVLQHGSLLLACSQWAPQLPGVRDLTSQSLSLEQFVGAFAEALGHALSIRWSVDPITQDEETRAERIAAERFASQRWLTRR